jgi:hypothetical protein
MQGIDATVKTLRNGNYGGILHALAAGDPHAVAKAIDQSPWGTHGALSTTRSVPLPVRSRTSRLATRPAERLGRPRRRHDNGDAGR